MPPARRKPRNRRSKSYSASRISWCLSSTCPPKRPSATSKRSIEASQRIFLLNILPASKARSASRSIKVRYTKWSAVAPAREQTDLTHADRAASHGICQALRARRATGRVDHARLGSGDPGVGLPQDRRRAAAQLSAGVGGGRRAARALFDHRTRSRSHLAHGGWASRDQPHGAAQG